VPDWIADRRTGAFEDERVFCGRVPIRYVLRPSPVPSDTLVVLFSGINEGEPPRYNWYRITERVPCHRLYVLDDGGAGELPRPSWYLGRAGSGFSDSVCELIQARASDLDVEPSQLITAGMSMGGWAALYYGVRAWAGHVIAGEPQVLLGQYLFMEEFADVARHIAGGSSSAAQRWLDGLLFGLIRASHSIPHVHLVCGRGSKYRRIAIEPLTATLDERGAAWDLELVDSDEHEQISAHFPQHLLGWISEIAGVANPPLPA
jgi:accessory secretory protein Asp2